MPELPDITVYVEALAARVLGRRLERIRLASPFLLRSVSPAPAEAEGRTVESVGRLGKQVVVSLQGGIHLVLHLMIAGRLRWLAAGAPVPAKLGLAAFDFDAGSLVLTEAGSKRRAALHIVRGDAGLAALRRAGLEVLDAGLASFRERLRSENHTLKRALTDPRLFSGIGNAYSDEILHAARLSPLALTTRLDDAGVERLHASACRVLVAWTERLRRDAAGGFPAKVTAFREGMAVHGRYGKPCPDCGTAVQRIAYADNECNYCPRCQTRGRLLADRAMSRLLRDDWPRTIEELESVRGGASG